MPCRAGGFFAPDVKHASQQRYRHSCVENRLDTSGCHYGEAAGKEKVSDQVRVNNEVVGSPDTAGPLADGGVRPTCASLQALGQRQKQVPPFGRNDKILFGRNDKIGGWAFLAGFARVDRGKGCGESF